MGGGREGDEPEWKALGPADGGVPFPNLAQEALDRISYEVLQVLTTDCATTSNGQTYELGPQRATAHVSGKYRTFRPGAAHTRKGENTRVDSLSTHNDLFVSQRKSLSCISQTRVALWMFGT